VVFSRYVLDNFVAPDVGSFDRAEIPDLTADFPQAGHWIAFYWLNSLARSRFEAPAHQLVFVFLWRSQEAFAAYHRAREATLAYLAATREGKQPIGGYHKAISHWETFALNYNMAISLLRQLSNGADIFKQNDGSKACRLYMIANKVKHICTKEYGPNDTVPLWLTNDGLSSPGAVVAFSEAAEELRDIAGLAEELKDPKSFLEKQQAWLANDG
jgi:hypothetical protein